MSKYEIIIYWSDKNSAYIAEVPEFPGCAADGEIYNSGKAKAKPEKREVLLNNINGIPDSVGIFDKRIRLRPAKPDYTR